MTPIAARIPAFLSVCGLGAGVLAYIYSFLFEPADKIWGWAVVALVPLWMALLLPMIVLEYPQSRSVSFSFSGFARGAPSWVAPFSWLLSLIFVAHFIWMAVHNGPGVPAIVNGQYALDSRGRILKILTQAEYLSLTRGEFRAFATIMVYFYFVTTTYWWFRASRLQSEKPSVRR